MILKSFQVRKYKNVRCSGEATLDGRADPLEGVDEATYDRFESLFMKINSLLR